MVRRQTRRGDEVFEIDDDEPVYVIGVVSQLTKLPIWTLRILDREEIVVAKRSEGGTRLYSMHDLKQLVHIRNLIVEQRVNVQGVRVILRMEIRQEYE